MNLRAFGIIAAGLLLYGCTDADWDNITSYVGAPPRTAESAPPPMRRESDAAPAPMQDEAAPAPVPMQGESGPAPRPPAAQVAASDAFCKGVGDSAGYQAGFQGFNPAYQARVAGTAYQQCMDQDSGRMH